MITAASVMISVVVMMVIVVGTMQRPAHPRDDEHQAQDQDQHA